MNIILCYLLADIKTYLHIDAVEPFPVNKYCLLLRWCHISYMCTLNDTNYTGEISYMQNSCLLSFFPQYEQWCET